MELSSLKNPFVSINLSESPNLKTKVGKQVLKNVANRTSNLEVNQVTDKFSRKQLRKPSKVMNSEELDTFRTMLCNDHINSKCLDPESCFNSHCSAWQRRNPNKFKYSPTICPDIDFSRKGNKGRMYLSCKCKKGKFCEFAHTKEEELYHPKTYKTKKCNSYPNCKRYYCPFIHSGEELIKSDSKNEIQINIDDFGKLGSTYQKNYEGSIENNEIIDANIYMDTFSSKKLNFDENKQEVLLMLLNCQKLILEENYYFAKQILEKVLLIISKLYKFEQFTNIISLNLWSNPIYYPNYLIKSDVNNTNKEISEKNLNNSFNFFMDIKTIDKNHNDLIERTKFDKIN